jgi:hypothetical protein
MSDRHASHATGTTGHGYAADHGSAADHDPEHAHAPDAESLGPIDLVAWAYAIAGGAVGLLVLLALYVASAT